jgi:uncharacterized LabA/DUF88 family protein
VGKNVAVFVDVANIFYAAKAAGVDIDYVTLLKSAGAGRDLVRAYAYTGLDPENENQRNFHSFLARNGYKVVSKDIRKYGDGKVKANLDIELVVDMMKTARNLDIAIVVSGDGDFAPAIRAVQEMGVRVEVISFRGNTSSDLMDVADQFTEITSLAKVEKGSSRSGRRVAGDDEDLSMTEVPDKQTEGTGAGRGRTGRGRERTRRELEPAARTSRPRRGEAAAVTSSGAPLVVLPGEKLSRVVPAEAPVALVGDEDEDVLATADAPAFDADGVETAEGAERRRRRRRGGRGRGRGRGRDAAEAGDVEAVEPVAGSTPDDDDVETPYVAAPRGPRTTPFGSVWDSQLGVPQSAPAARTTSAPIGDDEDFEEPEIPEYLIAERNRNRGGGGRGQGGGARGGRGVRAGYAAAVERERYGRGGGGGINRYPDVSARERPRTERPQTGGFGRPDRPDRQDRRDRPPAQPRSGGEWSEVPPEIEEMLRAQLSSGRPGGDQGRRPAPDRQAEPAPTEVVETPEVVEAAPARRPTTRRRSATAAEAAPIDAGQTTHAGEATEAAPKRRTTRKATTKAPTATAGTVDGEEAAPAKRRTTIRRTKATPDDASAEGATASVAESASSDADGAAPKRRTTRRKTAAEPTAD